MYAIIKTGGKQYKVEQGDKIQVEKLDAKVGSKVIFDEVVATGGDKLTVGTPFVKGYTVEGKVLEHGKGEKLVIYKYKAKKDYRRKNGHRQPFTLVEITKLGGEAKKTTEKKETVKKEEPKKETAKKAAPAKKETAAKKPAEKKATTSTAKKSTTAAKKPAAKKETAKKTTTAAKKPAAKKTAK